MAPTGSLTYRRQFAIQEKCYRAFRSAVLAQDEGLNPSATQSFRGSRSHATAEDRPAIAESFHNGGVAMRAMALVVITGAFASGVSGESVGPPFRARDLAIYDVENQKV